MSCSSHDIAAFDRLGVGGLFVAADAFVRAAESQAATLPIEPARVYVPSPIADRTDEEIRRLAQEHYGEVCALLVGERERRK